MAPRISWEWVGAYFDAEGCVNRCARNTQVTIAQKMRAPLDAVVKFLATQGIKATIVGPRSNGMHYLQVCAKAGMAEFLRNTFPYLFVKKQIAEDTWRFFTLFPAMSHAQTAKLATEDRWGMHVPQTPDERRAYQRKNKYERYWNDPVFRQERITYATNRSKRLREEKLSGNATNG